MDERDLERAILDLVRGPGYRPVKPRVIAERLQVPKDRAAEVKQAVKRLVKRGQLVYGSSHLVAPAECAKPRGNQVVGVFRRTDSGYGFVRPAGEAAPATPNADIFIPARYTADASHGDRVLVRLLKGGTRQQRGEKRSGLRGQIVEILERQTHQFVGTLHHSGGAAYVQVDGNLFHRPIYVGDAGSKNARPNDKVVFEMIRFPTHVDDGEGVITEVLGPRGKPGVDTLSIMREFDLPDRFSDHALAEARQQAHQFQKAAQSIPDGRLDLTHLTVVTIDPPDARDYDDAISLERSADGRWRLGVHIADVSHFVPLRTALDREARDRATSVYLPDRVLPMLPELISNGLASLQPGRLRYTKSVFMDFTPDGLRTDSQFCLAVIRSKKRLTYEQVDEFLKDPPAWRHKLGAKVHDLLLRMHELAMILRRRRIDRGALLLTMPELKVDLDAQGRVTGAHVEQDTVSHQIVEEFMLSANEAVAEMLSGHKVSFLRRVHRPPTAEKLKGLSEFVTALGIKNRGLRSRFELQELLQKVAGDPRQHAVNYAVLRAMQRAVYSPEEEGHYALASDCYCHFTSPIRRYPDLTVHRLLEAILAGQAVRSRFDELAALGEHCSERERRAETAERELTKVKLLAYLSQRIGEEMDAVITGVESFGLFLQGVELPAEGFVHVDALADDYYRFDRTTHTLCGYRAGNVYRLGDVVRVAVARVDIDRRELDFRLVGQPRRARVSAKSARSSVRSGRRQSAQPEQAVGNSEQSGSATRKLRRRRGD